MQIQVLTVCLFVVQTAAATKAPTPNADALSHKLETTAGSQVKQSQPQPVSVQAHGVSQILSGKPTPMDMINKFRAEVCAKLKDEHGKKFESFEKCKDFMKTACNPGKDGVMDGDGKEVTSGEGFCNSYFEEQEAEKKLKKAPAPAPPAPAPPAPALPAPVPAPPAPAPEVIAAPAPAAAIPAPAPAPAPVADDEAYYYKKDGKWSGRLHMDEKLKLPAQGYWGKLVEHEDQKTVTGDWGSEFGPAAAHRSYFKICKDHPDNVWCERQGFLKHSAGYKAAVSLAALVMPVALGFV